MGLTISDPNDELKPLPGDRARVVSSAGAGTSTSGTGIDSSNVQSRERERQREGRIIGQ